MELRQLRYFISVAEHLNFTKAAKHLFVDQSAVSQQIANLEKQIGVKLFLRNKRSVQLTNAGAVFLKEAVKLVEGSKEAVEKTRKAESGLIGSLNIGFLVAPVRGFLPQVIRRFNAKYPNVEINLNHFTTGHLNDALKTDDLDIVFTVSLGLQNIGVLECKTLFSDSTSAYLHHEHPLAGKSTISMAELASERFIFRTREEAPQWFDYTLMLCAKNGFSPTIAGQSRRIETVLMFVDAGIGVAILPKYLQMYATPTIRIVTIEEEVNQLDLVVYHKKTNLNPSIPLFMDELEAVMLNWFPNDRSKPAAL